MARSGFPGSRAKRPRCTEIDTPHRESSGSSRWFLGFEGNPVTEVTPVSGRLLGPNVVMVAGLGAKPKMEVDAGGCLVENARRITGRGRTAEVLVHGIGRVTKSVGQDGDFVLVIVDTETAAQDKPVLRVPGLPRESNLRPPVVFLRVVERAPHMNVQSTEQICARIRISTRRGCFPWSRSRRSKTSEGPG